ncbi:MAG TPA: ParA family protein [bacterium]|jgi:chromosome partitioning protein|nr:AAA family ATPase [bacterium]MDX9805505.1 ParA family protein [bacterium]HNW15429.1 ParA family protein [bacterium]HOG44302.1 ParA family protein [bacterium]HPG34970.1 ParA family protein [bacterium]
MGKVISIVNQKGGVGKTTTAVNLAACLGVMEKKVLLIDMDPQGNATSMSSVKGENFNTIYDMMADPSVNAIYPTGLPFLKIIPCNSELTGAEVELLQMDEREFVLRQTIDKLRNKFDFIIIDSPPSLNILTVNNMVASDGVIIPIQCEYFALEGLSRIIETIKTIKNLNSDLEIYGIVLTMYDKRVKLTYEVENDVREHFRETVFNTVIPRNVKLSESPSFGMPIVLYDISSIGAKKYLELAEEFLSRFKGGKK